jgi:hypothetical protein
MHTFTDFILEHENDDTNDLLLGKGKWPDIDMEAAAGTIISRRKLKTKVPQWYAVPQLIFPVPLAAEQCSSHEAASYKAGVCSAILSENGIPPESALLADLTGGMGVDSAAFSRICGNVIFNEMNKTLAEAAAYNFGTLGIQNIKIWNSEVSGDNVGEILGGEKPSIIYLDPARRSKDGRKVFLIHDCSPDILSIKDELFRHTSNILLKLSPMADISRAVSELGMVREVHIVAFGGECREMLIWMDKDWKEEYSITVCESGRTFSFRPSEEHKTGEELLADKEDLSAGTGCAGNQAFLFEPGKALMKAGAFNLTGKIFNIRKLGKSTHLYIVAGDQTEKLRKLSGFGKLFEIKEICGLNNRNIRSTGKKYPRCEVSAMNIRMTSDELRKKTGTTSGNGIHLFGAKVDFAENQHGNFIFVTAPMAAKDI